MKLLVDIPIDRKAEVPESDLKRLDAGHGMCVVCECLESYSIGDPAIPTEWCAVLKIKYADGFEIETDTRMAPILFYGFVKGYTEAGEVGCLSDLRLLASLAKHTADLNSLKVGPVELLPPNAVAMTLSELSVPTIPVKRRDGIEAAWMDAWKKSGQMVKMFDGKWYVETLCLPENQKYKVSRYVDGIETYYIGKTEYIELCTGEIKKTVDLTDGEMMLVADQCESPINCGWVDDATVRALYEAQQAAKADGKPIPKFTQDN